MYCADQSGKEIEKPSFEIELLSLATDFCGQEPGGSIQCGAVILTAGWSSCSSVAAKASGPQAPALQTRARLSWGLSWSQKGDGGKSQNREEMP